MFGIENKRQSEGEMFGLRPSKSKHFLHDFYKEITEDIYAWCFYLDFKPTWQQKQLLDAVQEGYSNVAVRSGQGPGKCLHGDTEILTSEGVKKIRDLIGREDLLVWSMDEATEKTHTASARCFPSGYKKCTTIRTDSGQSTRLSTDHPVYTSSGWQEASEITNGCLVAMPRNLQWVGTEEVPSEEVRWVGYILGDGGTTAKHGVRFTQEPSDSLDDFLHCCNSLEMTYLNSSSPSKARDIRVHHKASNDVLSRWSKRSLAKHKRLPDRFWSIRQDRAAEILATLWLCDGYFEKDGAGICLASEGLIDDVQTALLFWGIHSRKRYKKVKLGTKTFDSWRLSISGRESLVLFYVEILKGFHSFDKIKKGHVNYLTNIWSKPENTNTDVVPYDDKAMTEIAEELGIPKTRLREKGWRGRNYSLLSRKKFKELVSATGYDGKHAKWASNDIYWVRVVSNTQDRTNTPVYDLEVPEYGNFVARNLVVHNTAADAIVVPWWNLKYPKSLAVVTAPTMRQCKNVWLSEAQGRIQSGDPRISSFFNFTGTGYGIMGSRKDIWGCYLATANRPEAFQGIHNPYLLMLCEESSGIARGIMDTIKGTMSNAEGTFLWLQIGNPNTRTCSFFDCFHSQLDNPWHCLHWNGEETPETPWFSKRRNEEIAEEFGMDSDVYRVRVLGEFPHTDPSVLINENDLLACTKPEAKAAALAVNVKMRPVRKQIGIDLARYGGDKNSISTFSGNIMLKLEAYSRTDPNATIDRAVVLQEHLGWGNSECTFVVDTSGMGEMAAGMLGSQRRMGRKMHEFYSQNTAHESQKYDNKITEAWCLFAKEVRAHRMFLQYNKSLFQQLTNRLYSVTKHGKIKIETKDEYKKRNADSSDGELGMSPDEADSVVLGHYPHAVASTRVLTA